MLYTIFFPGCSGKIICNKIRYNLHFTSVLIEKLVALVNFDTFWPITFYVSIESENFVNESCLSHRDEAFDTKFDKLMLFNDF